jgi:hypothetical protein
LTGRSLEDQPDGRAKVEVVFEEAQLYAPITTSEDGMVTVHLDESHPGFGDPVYRERRNHIAARALQWNATPPTPAAQPIPHVDYTEAEQEVWRTVCRELAAKHERLAGEASRRLETDRARGFFAKVFWFSLEFGAHYQPTLFAADGIDELLEVVGGFFAECDDDSPARLTDARSVRG